MDEHEKPTLKARIRSYLKECYRVLRITKKPGSDEFQTIVKVAGLGMAAIGLIGFLISMIKQILF